MTHGAGGQGRRRRWRSLRHLLLVAVAAPAIGACGDPAPVSTAVPPTSSSPTSTTLPGLGFSDADSGRAATVALGQPITVILHSSDFVFAPPSDPSVVGADGPPTVTAGGPACTDFAGAGCGTVVARFVSLTPGSATLRAERPGRDAWTLTVDVVDGDAPIPTTSSTPPTLAGAPTTTGAAPDPPPDSAPDPVPDPVPGSMVRGTVRFSPVCPVERIPPDPDCAPRPGPADVELVRPDGTIAAASRAGDDGAFAIPAAPGRYAVRASVAGPGIGRGCLADPAEVTLEPDSSTTVSVSCDTGIR